MMPAEVRRKCTEEKLLKRNEPFFGYCQYKNLIRLIRELAISKTYTSTNVQQLFAPHDKF